MGSFSLNLGWSEFGARRCGGSLGKWSSQWSYGEEGIFSSLLGVCVHGVGVSAKNLQQENRLAVVAVGARSSCCSPLKSRSCSEALQFHAQHHHASIWTWATLLVPRLVPCWFSFRAGVWKTCLRLWSVEVTSVSLSVCWWCSVDALLGIYGSFLKFAPGGLPGWNGGGDPCAGIRGGANWGGVVCQSSNNGNCSTTVSGLYARLPSQLGDSKACCSFVGSIVSKESLPAAQRPDVCNLLIQVSTPRGYIMVEQKLRFTFVAFHHDSGSCLFLCWDNVLMVALNLATDDILWHLV